MERLQQILEEVGLEPQRIRMVNVSSAMAGQFAAAAREMCEQIEALGPNPLRLPTKPENSLENEEE